MNRSIFIPHAMYSIFCIWAATLSYVMYQTSSSFGHSKLSYACLIFIAALCLTFLWGLIKPNKNYSQTLLLSASSIAFTLLTLEVGLNFLPLFTPSPLTPTVTISNPKNTLPPKISLSTTEKSHYIKFSHNLNNNNSKSTIIRLLREKSIQAYPLMFPSLFLTSSPPFIKDIYPVSGISNTPTAFCNETGEYIVYNSDKYGFNNNNTVYNNDTDILLIGDSFTNGACVPFKSSIAGQLETRTNMNIINLGMSGNGSLLELASLVEYGKHLKPKKIFWFYYEGNDLGNTATEHLLPILNSYLNKGYSQNLISKQKIIDDHLRAYYKVSAENESIKNKSAPIKTSASTPPAKTNLNLSLILRLRTSRRLLLNYINKNLVPQKIMYEKIFFRIKEESELMNAELFFIFLPHSYKHTTQNFNNGHKEDLFATIRKLNIPIIDFSTEFDKTPDPLAFYSKRKKGGHYSNLGYKNLVKQVVRESETNKQDKTRIPKTKNH